MTLSMIFTVPKPDLTFRGINNLSDQSVTGISVNDCIEDSFKHVEYIAQKEIISRMQAVGPYGWLWVKDLEDGFHNVPVHPTDIPRLCIRMDNKIWQFQRLPMGLSSSPKLFTDFMRFPIYAASHASDIDTDKLYYINVDSRLINVSVFRDVADITQIGSSQFYRMCLIDSYVDDIFGLALTEAASWQQWHHSEHIFSLMNLRCKLAKGREPARINILLGKQYDLVKQWVRLGDEKFTKYHSLFICIRDLDAIPERTFLSVIGKARHMATIYKPLHAFARSLEVFIPYSNRFVKLGKGPKIKNSPLLKSRIQVLIDCAEIANRVGVPFSYFFRPDSNDFSFTIITDASMIGIGGLISDGSFFQNRWSDVSLRINHPSERDIQWRELAAIFAALFSLEHRYGDQLTDTYIHIFTDNSACKYFLIKMAAPLSRPDLQTLINEICMLCVRRRIHLWLDHIPGVQNTIADALSRFYPSPFSFEQHPNYYIHTPSINCSDITRHHLQRGADLSSSFLAQHNITIQRNDQEFSS
jgi:hypothetical protein